jgi:cytochrome b561
LIAVYAFIELRGIYPKGTEPRELMKAMHFMLGLSVLLLVVTRLAVRFSSPIPAIVPAPKSWEKRLANVMHIALYFFMFAMPVLGWLMLSASGKPIPFFGLELPPLMAQDKLVAEQLHERHEQLGQIGYFLIGLHAVAGLFHHYIKRDNTLVRLLPGRGK